MKAWEGLLRTGVSAAAAALLLVVSGRPMAAPAAAQQRAVGVSTEGGATLDSVEVARELAQVREATAKFKDFSAARAAGYTAQLTNCMDALPAGAMGYHFGNPAEINDPASVVTRPDLLLYEPDKDGSMQLVGVEWIIPYELVPASTTPAPAIFGRPLQKNDAKGIWALHVWAWRDNPHGVFFDWNPNVTCANAGADVTHLGATR